MRGEREEPKKASVSVEDMNDEQVNVEGSLTPLRRYNNPIRKIN